MSMHDAKLEQKIKDGNRERDGYKKHKDVRSTRSTHENNII